jgi:hypothetical protein
MYVTLKDRAERLNSMILAFLDAPVPETGNLRDHQAG